MCRKNRGTASARRRKRWAVVASGQANQAGTLAVLGCACVCDRCGQERSSHLGKEGSRQIQAAQNRRKKLLRPLPDSARVGFSHRCSCSFSFWKARFGGFSFFRSSGFLQLLPQDRPESEWPRSSLPEYLGRGKRNATKKCFFQVIQL